MTRIALSRLRKQYRVTYIRRAAPPRNRRSVSTPGRLPLIADRPAAAERSADDKMRVVTVLRSPGALRQLTVARENLCFTDLVLHVADLFDSLFSCAFDSL